MDRRTFLTASALSLVASTELSGVAAHAKSSGRVIYTLPKSETPRFAWTVDDGASERTVAGYVNLLKANPELKITFFVTSGYQSWRRHEKSLNDLIANGQVQLANHTLSHPDLTKLSSKSIRHQLGTCKKFLDDHFESSGVPFYRPPYGTFDTRVREVAAELGYTRTVMWYGTLADAGQNTQRGLLRNAKRWINDRAVLISHANHPQIIDDFEDILALIANRNLATVTLSEVFG